MRRRTLSIKTLLLAMVASLVPGFASQAQMTNGGSELWVQRYEGPGLFAEGAQSVVVSPDGSKVFVTGGIVSENVLENVMGNADRDIATVAYDAATGDLIWDAVYDGPAVYDFVADLAVSPDGSKVLVTGNSDNGDGGADYVTIAYEAESGDELWVRRYNGAGGEDGGVSLVVSPDSSNVYVTGASKATRTAYDFVTLAYDAATGRRLWLRRAGGRGNDAARAVDVSPDGSRIVVTGLAQDRPKDYDYPFLTIAYAAASGERLWRREHRTRGASDPGELAINPSGSKVFVTGSTSTERSGGYTTVAYSLRSGRRLWVRNQPGPSGGYAQGLVVSPDGARVFVTGWVTRDAPWWDYATVAYRTTTGERLWKRRYGNASRLDGAMSTVVSPDGSTVYVTGVSERSSEDYATIAYRALDGEQIWVARYDGPRGGRDAAMSIAVSPDGSRVYVAGSSEDVGEANAYPYVTIAYATK